MPKAIGIDHIAIYVEDMEASKKFFMEGLGLTPKMEYGDEFFMNIGDQIIAVFQGENQKQINHLALKVDDFEGMKEHLDNMGYKVYDGDMVDDSNGIRVQLIK